MNFNNLKIDFNTDKKVLHLSGSEKISINTLEELDSIG